MADEKEFLHEMKLRKVAPIAVAQGPMPNIYYLRSHVCKSILEVASLFTRIRGGALTDLDIARLFEESLVALMRCAGIHCLAFCCENEKINGEAFVHGFSGSQQPGNQVAFQKKF